MRYKTEKGRPLCRYCKKLLAPENATEEWMETTPGGSQSRQRLVPTGNYGRLGNNLFCTLSCTEEWAMRRLAGRSVPRGKSHEE